MAANSQTLSLADHIELFREIWQAIMGISACKRAANNLPPLTQNEVATSVKADDAIVSRILRGIDLPKNNAVLVRIAKEYGASDSQIRALLTLASAIAAEEANEKDLALLYRGMFDPLFEVDTFAQEINSPANVVFHGLLDLGVSRNAAIAIGKAVTAATSEEAAVGGVILALNRSDEPTARDALKRLPELLERTNTLRQIVAIDPDVPWAGRLGRRVLRQGQNDGVQHATWSHIPNVLLTKISLDKGKHVRDIRHGGVEFLFLASGAGIFEMQSVGKVDLTEEGRQVIAYKPAHPHHFTATLDATRLWVVSYLRPEGGKRDAIREVLRSARRFAGALGRKLKPAE